MMFCPEGYSTIWNIYDFAMGARLERSFEAAIEFCEAGARISEEEEARQFFRIAPMDWVEFAMFQAIGSNLFMSSPDGRVMWLDMRALRSAVDFWEFTVADLEEVAKDHPEIGEPPQDFRHNFRLFDYPGKDFLEEFKNPSANTSSANLWDFAKSLNMDHLHHQVPMFYERRGYTITLQVFDYINQFNFMEMDEWADIARILRPFEGWSMCVKQEWADKGAWKEFLLGVNGQDRPEQSSGTAGEALSPAAVGRKMVHEWRQGRKLSKPEFKRRLAPGKSKGWFDMAWQIAVSEEEDMAKGGRRPKEIIEI